MAFSSANIFLQNKTLTSLTPPVAIKLRKNPKFIPKSSCSHQFLQTHNRRISLTISAATEVASDFEVQEKLSDSDKVPNMSKFSSFSLSNSYIYSDKFWVSI